MYIDCNFLSVAPPRSPHATVKEEESYLTLPNGENIIRVQDKIFLNVEKDKSFSAIIRLKTAPF